jgi:membrane associated rhomboid family serine protease
VLTLVTSLFLHVDIFHLLGNMWFLLVFGRNVECAMNHVLFLTFYLVCGVAAGVAHTLSDAGSIIPTIGASGAISGIMGAYISIHPLNKIKIWLFIAVVEWPALVVIGLWFVDNYLCAFLSLENAATHGGVAHWAHLGGFVAGFVILRTLVMCLQIKRRVAGRRDKPSEPAQVEAADPFGTFISVQTVRKMRDQAP